MFISKTISFRNASLPDFPEHLFRDVNKVSFCFQRYCKAKYLMPLDLAFNMIREVPSKIRSLKYLCRIDLSHNIWLTDLPFRSLQKLPSLKFIDASNSGLKLNPNSVVGVFRTNYGINIDNTPAKNSRNSKV